ncbi:MAG: hypothetical protein P8K83_01565 [Woeseiaceae bacterium]|nr:hypothetical protein [Woeseiaceae bacterium]
MNKNIWFLSLALIVGVFLRFYQLPDQIITGDEWHAINKALLSGYADIATSFGAADHSIPIALYYKLMLDSFGLQQWMIQLPFAIAGCITIVIVPLMLIRTLGWSTSVIVGGLLAVSPALIIWSRFARPYSIAYLLSVCAVILFFLWWQKRSRRVALLYAVCAAMSGYFLVLNLPFVLSPFIVCFAVVIFRDGIKRGWQRKRQDIMSLLGLGLLTAFLLAVLLLPPLVNDFAALSGKSGGGSFYLADIWRIVPLFSGNAGIGITVLSVLLACVGVVRAWYQRSSFLAYLSAITLIQILAIRIANPVGTENIVILARYLLLVTPLYFILISMGISAIADRLTNSSKRKEFLGLTLAITILIVGLLLGPMRKSYYSPNNNIVLMTISEIVLGDRLYESMLGDYVSPFYEQLSEYPAGEKLIVQAPFFYNFDYLPLYQHLNKQTIAVGYTEGLCSLDRVEEIAFSNKERVSINNSYYLNDPQSLIHGGVDFVVFHKNLNEEIVVPVIVEEYSLDACIEFYRQNFGEPIFEDNIIVTFEIQRN